MKKIWVVLFLGLLLLSKNKTIKNIFVNVIKAEII